jgi:nitrate/TMAO reductase-like tetraheme cytochrome c subunit
MKLFTRKNRQNGEFGRTTRRKRRLPKLSEITIDLGNPKHQRRLLLGLILLVLFSTAFVYVNYQVYHYTESSEFCGTACHPMVSQNILYEQSPHANVECVKCHIGPGASYYVRSKLDGIRQVYAVLTDSYSKPIKSPIHNLRPAREICEECHKPETYKDNIVKTIPHYDNDQNNTLVQSTFILKMGGWQDATGIAEGIHWHITNKVYYIAADEQRQVITWVGVEQDDGSLKEYYARDMLAMAQTNFVEEAFANDEVRLMDCIDCHNRAAHYIPPPQEMVDDAIHHGVISQDIPYIRRNAVNVLSASYESTAAAYNAIEQLADFYVTNSNNTSGHDAKPANFELELMNAIAELKTIYSETTFPEMGLDWTTNPNNEDHTPTLGCFRCHDDKHISVNEHGAEIDTISVKCNLCHTVPIVGRGDQLLVESPVIVGQVPESHSDFSWTVEHRDVSETEKQDCYQCHGQGFCNNGICHNLDHPPDMLYTHADEYWKQGNQVCYTCHQDISCTRCHAGGIIKNP